MKKMGATKKNQGVIERAKDETGTLAKTLTVSAVAAAADINVEKTTNMGAVMTGSTKKKIDIKEKTVNKTQRRVKTKRTTKAEMGKNKRTAIRKRGERTGTGIRETHVTPQRLT